MKSCCDWECAEANNCQVGGIECDRCGNYFCSSDLGWHKGRYVCDDCKTEMIEEEEDDDN